MSCNHKAPIGPPTTIMLWFHEDPEYTLRLQLEHGEDNHVMDIIGGGPMVAHQLTTYNIETIGQLVDYVISKGFPRNVEFRDESKFVISARCAKKFLGNF